jgi:riboflavin synthase
MFTGIVEEIGTVRKITRRGHTLVLTIGADAVTADVRLGDSIAVNGVCLTVVQYDRSSVSMDVMPETFRQTNLSELAVGSRVNLERAMAAGGRFGGHIVQGHVDCVGVITAREAEENAVLFTIRPNEPEVNRWIIPRGSVALDGISLTVVRCGEGQFQVSIIPHTLANTILQDKIIGSTVNIEADLIGKYVAHFLERQGEQRPHGQGGQRRGGITAEFLAEHGFA